MNGSMRGHGHSTRDEPIEERPEPHIFTTGKLGQRPAPEECGRVPSRGCARAPSPR